MNFGNKPSIGDKAKAVEKRLGKTTKGTAEKARPKVKIRPSGTKPGRKQIGAKITLDY